MLKSWALVGVMCLAGVVSAQTETRTRPEEGKRAAGGTLAKVAALRQRVREMRKSVLGGGPAVWKAQEEALRFYRRKLDETAARLVDLRTQRDAQEAEYRAALQATLEAAGAAARAQAARRAAALRRRLQALAAEITALTRQRNSLGKAIAGLEARMARRKRLLARLEREATANPDAGIPFGPEITALGPDAAPAAEEDPFADDQFWRDLFAVDPRRARALLLQQDPERYWKVFPLRPPLGALKEALRFPLPDPPGRR